MYVCMHVYTFVYICICICVCMYVHKYIYRCVHTYVHLRVYTYMHVMDIYSSQQASGREGNWGLLDSEETLIAKESSEINRLRSAEGNEIAIEEDD